MITVEKFLETYCRTRNLPAPSQEDLRNIGNLIGYHFRHFWAPANYRPGDVIPDSGFMCANGFVVNFYPDAFMPDMVERTDLFYSKKSVSVPAGFNIGSQHAKGDIVNVRGDYSGKKRKRKPIAKEPENKKFKR